MKRLLRIFLYIGLFFGLVVIAVWFLAQSQAPKTVSYGASFNTFYATDLGLDWRQVYDATLHDLGVRHLRLAAHWPMIEPIADVYNFSELDYQIAEAEKVGAEVILAVGRRLPRWPECHVPRWASRLSWEEQQVEILEYTEKVVERYRDSPAISYWQLENEPYLEVFAKDHCGEFDEAFFASQVAHFRQLDLDKPLLLTDSGNLGTWWKPYRQSDAFGTSVYVYFWNPELGQFKTILPPWVYRVKDNLMSLLFGEKETMLIELSAEPWLIKPITETAVAVQLERMNIDTMKEILEYAKGTHLSKQYLWGVEWWYWMKERENPEFWELAKTLYE